VQGEVSSERVWLTAAVCTRNRPKDIAECVKTILANAGSDFELLVVDQSGDTQTRDALQVHAADTRLRYHATSSRGLSRARNIVLEHARADLIAFTDDDCRVDPDWATNIRTFFMARPAVALAFGRVFAPPELQAQGHIASFEPKETSYRDRFPSPMDPWGIGANMVLSRRLAIEAGGFDPCLGAGAKLPAGEELDFAIRILGAGLPVANTARFSVTHLGVREHEAAREQFLVYSTGAGAAYLKNVRLRTPGARKLLGQWFAGMGLVVARAAWSGRRPLGLGTMIATLRGGFEAMKLPLDRDKKTLVDVKAASGG
jgi:GT2 family glycosyltransferase